MAYCNVAKCMARKTRQMDEIRINEKISYIPSHEEPLSAEIGIIRENDATWLYDVGSGKNGIMAVNERYNVVLSHFHQDHTANIDRIQTKELFVSKETFTHIHKGTVVYDDLTIGNLHVFHLPSSHAKGCLGLEVDNTYAFIGDATYCKVQNGCYVYNAQLLKEEIETLENLKATFLLVSHFAGFVRRKEDVVAELKAIYETRDSSSPEIVIGRVAE